MSGRSAARPKRAGEEFARNHYAEGSTSKKPRFDARAPIALAPDENEEDVVLDADVIGKRGLGVKRNAVNIDGYDSDSSNDGARAAAKKNGKAKAQSKDADENDMFDDLEPADGDQDEDLDREGKGKKSVRFIEENEIEGQVKSSKSGGHVRGDFIVNEEDMDDDENNVESSSEDEIGDEERAAIDEDMDEELGAGAKKHHAPVLDAFNMAAENEEGKFDEQFNYVRKVTDPDAIHDTWMEGFSKKEMRKAKDAQDKRDQERRQQDIEADAQTTGQTLQRLIPLLQIGETVLEALARLGKREKKEKKVPQWKLKKLAKKSSGETMAQDANGSVDDAEVKRKQDVETITDAADKLLSRGQTDIYETEREILIRQYTRETGDEWHDARPADEDDGTTRPADDTVQWEYRWSDKRDGGDNHGPYDGATMSSWQAAGYFGEGVLFRRVGGSDDDWSGVPEFTSL